MEKRSRAEAQRAQSRSGFWTQCAEWEVCDGWGGEHPVSEATPVPGRRVRYFGFGHLVLSVSYHKDVNIVFNYGLSRAKSESRKQRAEIGVAGRRRKRPKK
jgi:hypothetical protein